MSVLVTGGAGFIGSHVVQALLAEGRQVVVLDSFDDFYDPLVKERNLEEVCGAGEFTLIRSDIRDTELVATVFESHRPAVVVHLAALAGVRPSLADPERYCDVNIGGTAGLLEMARRFEVANFIFGSSSSVYGLQSAVPFSEDDPAASPISPYAATKRAGELLCHSYHESTGQPVTCLRFFTVYGPRQRPEMAIHKFTRKILANQKLPVYHEGKSQRDYTFIDDITAGVLAAVRSPLDFEIINLGNSSPTRLLDLIRLLEQQLDRSAQVELMPAQPGDAEVTCADISKAQRLLSWQPATPIELGLRRFAEWLDSATGPQSRLPGS